MPLVAGDKVLRKKDRKLATPRLGTVLQSDNLHVEPNHPSGEKEPSQEDLRLTQLLIDCGETLQIPLLDHVIVGHGNFSSLRRTSSLWGKG
ncbi:MAG: hypothetical protein H7Y37_07945 [Anaerolineae bacterium]|nr:hypothetical protein [Gloeobacterales cyanobacterium ES-bin-313]